MSMCFGVTSVYSFVFSSLFPRYIRNETLEITHWCIGFLWKVVLSLKWGVWVWEGGQNRLILPVIWKRYYSDPKHLAKATFTIVTENLPVIQASLYCVFIYFYARKFLLY